jgi:hypothetical protein
MNQIRRRATREKLTLRTESSSLLITLSSDIHRFGLYLLQSIFVDIIQEIWNLLFTRKLIFYYPPRFVLHGWTSRKQAFWHPGVVFCVEDEILLFSKRT